MTYNVFGGTLNLTQSNGRGATSEYRLKISLQCGQFDPKFQAEGVAPNNHSFSEKTGLNALSYGTGIKIWTDFSSVLSQSSPHV